MKKSMIIAGLACFKSLMIGGLMFNMCDVHAAQSAQQLAVTFNADFNQMFNPKTVKKKITEKEIKIFKNNQYVRTMKGIYQKDLEKKWGNLKTGSAKENIAIYLFTNCILMFKALIDKNADGIVNNQAVMQSFCAFLNIINLALTRISNDQAKETLKDYNKILELDYVKDYVNKINVEHFKKSFLFPLVQKHFTKTNLVNTFFDDPQFSTFVDSIKTKQSSSSSSSKRASSIF